MILLDDDPQPWERQRNERIRELAVGVNCLYSSLPCDTAFYGYGPERTPIIIGVEVKKPDDMADSVVRTGRLVQQFRACSAFGISVMYLFFQGIIRPGPDGYLEKYVGPRKNPDGSQKSPWDVTNPPVMYGQMDNFLNTVDVKGGVHVKKTSDPRESAHAIVDLYHWWQRSPEEHTSMDRFNTAGGAAFLSKEVPFFRKMVKEIPAVGWVRSLGFYETFRDQGHSTLDVLNMSAKEWQKVKGVGPTIANDMHKVLHEPI